MRPIKPWRPIARGGDVAPGRVRAVDLDGAALARGAARDAVRALVEGRLLHTRTTGGSPRCEIAHGSLIESWGSLRGWLDDDTGHRAVHKRVETASAEWERLLRTREALWGQRQLDE